MVHLCEWLPPLFGHPGTCHAGTSLARDRAGRHVGLVGPLDLGVSGVLQSQIPPFGLGGHRVIDVSGLRKKRG